jgi:hypothetical protein
LLCFTKEEQLQPQKLLFDYGVSQRSKVTEKSCSRERNKKKQPEKKDYLSINLLSSSSCCFSNTFFLVFGG